MTPLRQRMLEDMSIRNLAEKTQQSYLQQVLSFARYFSCPPDKMGPEQVREYQLHLVEDNKLKAVADAVLSTCTDSRLLATKAQSNLAVKPQHSPA